LARPPPPLTLFPYTTLFRSQSVQRRRAGELRRLFAWDHALHQRLDHDAAAHGGDSAVEPARARRRRAPENHAVDPLRHTWVVHLDRKSTRLNSSHVKISYAV